LLLAVIIAQILLVTAIVEYGAIGLFVFLYSTRHKFESVQDLTTTFTVYLPTFNEEKNIRSKLDNLLEQTAFQKLDGEILIFDCSTDQTKGILRRYACDDSRIRIIEQPMRIGMARTFNEAIKEARGRIFVKTDCDSIATSKEELSKLLYSFSDNGIGAVTGVCVSVAREASFRNLMTRLQVAESNLDSTLVAHSSSFIAIRREALHSVDPDSLAEDTEAFLIARRLGFRAIVNPNVVSVEKLPVGYLNRLRQKQRRAHGIIRTLFRNGDMLFNRRYGLYGEIVLPLNLFLLVVSPLMLISDILAMVYISLVLYPLATGLILVGLLSLLIGSSIGQPRWLSGIVDLQLSSLLGLFDFLAGRSSPVWKVHRE
jgi:cellulose synthase/poly-beta-1,6-N-acetylglucosamine synthase-like glycosyltransferase